MKIPENGVNKKMDKIENMDFKPQEVLSMQPLALAFIGDAVYETFVRKYVFHKGILRPDRLNSASISYVRAEAQAMAYDRLLPDLAADEASVARRAKNHKITSMPKNVDPMVYKKATAFEALLGYLELKGDPSRVEEIIFKAFEIIESEDIKINRR